MKISKKTDILGQSGGFWLGATAVRVPLPNGNGTRDWLLAADCMEKSDGVKFSKLFRSDNGIDWNEQDLFEHSESYGDGKNIRRDGYGSLYADERLGLVFYFGNELFWENDKLDSTWRMRKLYYRFSGDNGKSWSEKIQIIQDGTDEDGSPYDANHYMKSVLFGRNMACMVIPFVLRQPDGSILMGVQSQIADENGEAGPTGWGYLQSGGLIGRWNVKTSRFDWDFGNWVTVPLETSTRGLYEPVHALLPDGQILMIMRGSNYTKEDSIIGCKFFCLSKDGGLTWSEPQPLLYNDGSVMFSSSCIPKLLKHSSGRLFFIGVINDKNPRGNLPRYPLCIAEIDQENHCVMKSTVTVIDTKPEETEDTLPVCFPVDFSNHGVFENDRGQIVVLAPYRPDLFSLDGVLNQYTIMVN